MNQRVSAEKESGVEMMSRRDEHHRKEARQIIYKQRKEGECDRKEKKSEFRQGDREGQEVPKGGYRSGGEKKEAEHQAKKEEGQKRGQEDTKRIVVACGKSVIPRRNH